MLPVCAITRPATTWANCRPRPGKTIGNRRPVRDARVAVPSVHRDAAEEQAGERGAGTLFPAESRPPGERRSRHDSKAHHRSLRPGFVRRRRGPGREPGRGRPGRHAEDPRLRAGVRQSHPRAAAARRLGGGEGASRTTPRPPCPTRTRTSSALAVASQAGSRATHLRLHAVRAGQRRQRGRGGRGGGHRRPRAPPQHLLQRHPARRGGVPRRDRQAGRPRHQGRLGQAAAARAQAHRGGRRPHGARRTSSSRSGSCPSS